jgi:iron complex outermembrane receptor protein
MKIEFPCGRSMQTYQSTGIYCMKALRSTRLSALAVSLLASSAFVAPALSQTTPPPPSGVATPALPDIVVVAQRRPQNAQKIGVSVTTLSAKQLADNGVRKVNDIQYYVPNLQIRTQFGTGQPSFAIRGVGTDFNDYASNNAPVVGYYVDEIAYPIPSMTQGQLFDIKDIEVLRGPQGTLYGRNVTAGAINILLNKPTNHLTYGGSVEYDNWGEAVLQGYVSGPITDNLRIRLSGDTNQGGAWQYNRANGASLGNNDTKGLRTLVDWDATSNLSFELNLHWDRDQSDGIGSYLLAPRTGLNGSIIPADTDVRATGWGATPAFAQEVGISTGQKPFRDNQGYGADLTTTYLLPFAKLTSLTSAERFDRQEYDALDGTSVGGADVYFSTRAGAYAEELRLTSLTNDPLSWQAGLYYSREHLDEVYDSGFATIEGPLAPGVEGGLALHTPYTQDVETKSAYAHAEYDVTSQWKLVGGIRLENEQRKISNFYSQGFLTANGVSTGDEVLSPTPASQSTQYTLPSWKVELDYQALQDTLFYASIADGVKSGGFTTYNSGHPALAIEPFKPERLLAYEIGTKNEFLDHRVLLNADAFYYDYTDQQILGITVNSQTGAVGSFVNAPKSHLYGGEAELDLLPIDGLRIDQSVGLTAGAFDRFTDTVGVTASPPYAPITANLAGRGLGAPRWTYNINASYDFPINENYTAQVGGDFSYIDQYVSLLNTSATTHSFNLPAYSLLNLYATVIPNFHHWQLGIFGRNVLNRKYLLSNNYFDSVAYPIAIQGEPASYGFRLSYNFN